MVALKKFTSEQVGLTTLVDDPVRASRGGWVFDSNTKEGKDPLGSYDLVSEGVFIVVYLMLYDISI